MKSEKHLLQCKFLGTPFAPWSQQSPCPLPICKISNEIAHGQGQGQCHSLGCQCSAWFVKEPLPELLASEYHGLCKNCYFTKETRSLCGPPPWAPFPGFAGSEDVAWDEGVWVLGGRGRWGAASTRRTRLP